MTVSITIPSLQMEKGGRTVLLERPDVSSNPVDCLIFHVTVSSNSLTHNNLVYLNWMIRFHSVGDKNLIATV